MSTEAWYNRPLSGGMTALLVALGIIAVTAGGVAWSRLHIADGAETTELQVGAAQQEARRAVGQHHWSTYGPELLSKADQRDAAALQEALAQVDRYFDRAHRGTGPFSKAVLSWDAQWSLAMAKIAGVLVKCDRLPSWLKWRWLCNKAKSLAGVMDQRAFHKHVAGELARHVFSQQDLHRLLTATVQRYQQRLAATDAALLGPMQPAAASPPVTGESRRYESVTTNATQAALVRSRTGADSELLRTLAQSAGSKLLVALAAYALKEGAVELGLLSAGTASSIWSLGAGLAVAALANVALRHLLDRAGKSPRKSIERRVAAEVAAMRRCVIDGCTRQMRGRTVTIDGLRSRLRRYQSQRAERRARSLRHALTAS